MKYLMITLILLCSCNSSDTSVTSEVASSSVVSAEPNLDEFGKEKDEGCSAEDDLKKKIEQAAKENKPQAIKLQGGDTGCSTGE